MSSSKMVPIGIILFLIGLITLVVVANSSKPAKKVEKIVRRVEKPIEEIIQKQEEVQSEDVPEEKKVEEDPHDAFPQMTSDGDADSELASAFTYENLQDSMLTSVREAREASKSRAPWSRFGERSNPEIWEAQMAELKNEIISSGKSFEEFAESSWGPIPEQMADYWKNQQTSQLPEPKSHRVEQISRAAISEAPALLKDSTQEIGKQDNALDRMEEILNAQKRAKSLKIALPLLSLDQKKDIDYWKRSSSKKGSSVANALSAF